MQGRESDRRKGTGHHGQEPAPLNQNAGALSKLLHEGVDQQGYVLGTFAQRRHTNRQHVETKPPSLYDALNGTIWAVL